MPLPPAASSALDDHAAVLAHELATPLATAADAVRNLQSDGLAEDDRAAVLAILARAIGNAQQLVERLRTVGLQDEQLAARREVVDLATFVREVVGDLRRTTLAAHTVEVDAAPDLRCAVDPTTFRLVLGNLLGNAARYAPNEHPITVHVAAVADEAHVTVADRGDGVAPEDAERIFERGERGETDSRGLGLGLYLARRVARAHGGDLTLEPAETSGAVFVVRLPAFHG